jgi:hypothetical protein
MVRRGSPDPAVIGTAGLLGFGSDPVKNLETCGPADGDVGRPRHNTATALPRAGDPGSAPAPARIDGRFLPRFQEAARELELGTLCRSFDLIRLEHVALALRPQPGACIAVP